jgi:hypothetical protein
VPEDEEHTRRDEGQSSEQPEEGLGIPCVSWLSSAYSKALAKPVRWIRPWTTISTNSRSLM